MVEIANAQLSANDLEGLVSKMFSQAGIERRMSLTFEDFSEVMAVRLDLLWDVCLDFKGDSRHFRSCWHYLYTFSVACVYM